MTADKLRQKHKCSPFAITSRKSTDWAIQDELINLVDGCARCDWQRSKITVITSPAIQGIRVVIMDWNLIQVLSVLFFASFIRSAFGFGEALIAVPLLALIIPVNVAAPVAVLISITIAGIIVLQDWQHVHFRSAGWLVLWTSAGTPLGLILLSLAAEQTIKLILAVIIIAFSAYSLLSRRQAALRDDRLAWLFGFGAGVLGGAYGMNGPPLVIYGTLRGWSPQQFRATLQGYFLPASLMVMGGYWFTGLWSSKVTHYYFIALPEVVVAIFLGRAANRRMSGHSFLVYVHVGLIVVGTLLLSQSILQR